MELSIQEVHYYNDLVNSGLAAKLVLHGVDEDAIVIPQLDDFDKVYFFDLSSKMRVYPGLNVIEKIKKTLDLYQEG